ncbi:MAG: DNA mismatch repair protein MutS [Saprospiraceae bacterium]|nr:DNA mismatch repair protein MutS [Saprospiraceae bacterium]
MFSPKIPVKLGKKPSSKSKGKTTPLMQQYFQMKQQHPDALLLFRVGDFYETFGEDAVKAAKALAITLTSRNNGGSDIALAGFPYHSLDVYLPRLVRAGYRVAVCEQLEKPSKEKKIVKRGVTEVITPGVAVDDQLLEAKRNNYLASLSFGRRNELGVALIDLSTGEFLCSEGDRYYIEKILQSFNPNEIIFSKSHKSEIQDHFASQYYTYGVEEWVFTLDYAREKLLTHFNTQSLKGYGIEDLELGQVAAGSVLHYLNTTENFNLQHIRKINRLERDRFVWLDRFTIRNLELLTTTQPDGIPLIDILDKTVNPMGGRLLRKWVVLPLKEPSLIQERLDMVEFLVKDSTLRADLIDLLQTVGDLERLLSKVPLGKINPREVYQLGKSLTSLDPVQILLEESEDPGLKALAGKLDPCGPLREQILHQLKEEPPVSLSKGGVIAEGVNEELDELRRLIHNSKEVLAEIQKREAEATGITNLKIGFNNVFGFYLEVTNKYKGQGLVPDNWIRKQTLTNSERYITEELKQLETKILGAEEKVITLEATLFESLVQVIVEYIDPIQQNAFCIATLDCLLSFAQVAYKQQYCKPSIDDSFGLDIKQGRHPVIEQHLDLGESYVPNDVFLNNEDKQIIVITGPNMSGKSAVLRQTALIALMAQMGSFVPAQSAKIGYLDRVFTRVGASDNLSTGESTFMVEMNETASIMNNLSDRSLILLDEIGRGTSTYDGISIAWSLVEFLHQNGAAKPKTLFATHYHELNELADKLPGVHNYNISTRQVGNKVIFLRKLVPGGSNHSFGIYVARLAGMPASVVARAQEILSTLEEKAVQLRDTGEGTADILKDVQVPSHQLSIFETVDPLAGKIKEAILDLDVNSMTPIECMMKLAELSKLVKEQE